MAKRENPEVNAGSMADIAFLLLIFFLVTTTMDTDSGLVRKLPPWNPDPVEDNNTKIKERNVYPVLINKHNQLAVRGDLMDIKLLSEGVKAFIQNPRNNPKMSEQKEKNDIPFIGSMMVSKGVVSLQNDKGTEYGKYIEVQNELVRAFNEMRDELSKAKFGKKYDDLDDDRQKAIRQVYPLAISEAEPKNTK